MKQNEELKACPFCHSSAEIRKSGVRIDCQSEWCNAFMTGVQGKGLLIKAWNTRHQPEQPSGDMPDDIQFAFYNLHNNMQALNPDEYPREEYQNNERLLKLMRERADLASQAQVDVEGFCEKICNDILGHANANKTVQSNTIIDTIHYLNEKGYLRTPKPTTDEKRVMDLMAEALQDILNDCMEWDGDPNSESPMQDVFKPYHPLQKALAEYEKLKGNKS